MEISQYTWSRQTVVLSGRDGSVSNRSPQWSFYANRIWSDESHCKPGCSQLDVEDALSNVSTSFPGSLLFPPPGGLEEERPWERGCQMCLKVTRPVLRISRSRAFEGHCALTNADEVNEVQQNVVTAKKGKKARHKSNITSFQVNNLTCNSKF